MNARLQPRTAPRTTLRAMTVADLDTVLALEARAYAFPWTRGNFTDSLAAGYLASMLLTVDDATGRRSDRSKGDCLGYFLAMPGVEEVHLLNITVDPDWQGLGLARRMLAQLGTDCLALGAPILWLEVRASNERARRLYARWGFETVGQRKGYYPAARGQREDAIVMRLNLAPEACRALD